MFNDEDKKEFKNLIKSVEAYFIQYNIDEVRKNKFADRIKDLDADYQNIANTFNYNIDSMLSALNIPFILSSAAAQQQHHFKSHLVSVIESLKYKVNHDINDSDDPILDQIRSNILKDKMNELDTSEKSQEQLVLNIYRFLEPFTREEKITGAASALLYQGAILLWSAFETLSKDLFIIYINKNPHKIKDLLDSPSIKKRLNFNKITPETLMEYDFDLSNKMGEVTAENQDFSDLETIKKIFNEMFPASCDDRSILNDPDIWILSQKRHLIVHRGGIVDKKYLDKTGESLCIGDKLLMTPTDLISYFEKIYDCGISLFTSLPIES